MYVVKRRYQIERLPEYVLLLHCFAFGDKIDSSIGEALLSRSRLVKFFVCLYMYYAFSMILASISINDHSLAAFTENYRYPTQMSRQKDVFPPPKPLDQNDKISQTIRLLPSPITGARMTPVTTRRADHLRRLVPRLVVQRRQWKD